MSTNPAPSADKPPIAFFYEVFTRDLAPPTWLPVHAPPEGSSFASQRRGLHGGIERREGAWFGPDGGRAVLTPFADVEWEPRNLVSSYVQTRFQLGGGYKFAESAGDGLCQTERFAPLRCRGAVVRTGLSFTLFERLRLKVGFEAMPFQKDRQLPWQLLPGLGLQFYF